MGTNQPPSALGSSTIAQQAFQQAQARYTQYKEEISKMDSGATAKDDQLRKFMLKSVQLILVNYSSLFNG